MLEVRLASGHPHPPVCADAVQVVDGQTQGLGPLTGGTVPRAPNPEKVSVYRVADLPLGTPLC